MYKIETPPAHGSIIRLHRKPRQKRQVTSSTSGEYSVVRNFTHQDVSDNVIQYRANEGRTYAAQQDSFSYKLEARDVQPAPGVFRLTVQASHQPTTVMPTPVAVTKLDGKPDSDSSETESVNAASAGSKK